MEKVKRSYSSPRRKEQAAATRRAVLESARRLFVDHGYGATSIQRIADGAGVSVQTIYAVFGDKKTVLDQLLDVSIAGDDRPVAVNDRDWMRIVFDDPDPRARLRAYARAIAGIYERAGDIFAVVRAAGDTDADVVPLAETTEQRRRSGAAAVVKGLASLGALREDLDDDRAVDILWTLNSPDLFRRLVRDCGWTIGEYEQWIGATMTATLLAPQSPSSDD